MKRIEFQNVNQVKVTLPQKARCSDDARYNYGLHWVSMVIDDQGPL
jgi:hypothetical protein